MKNFLRFLRKVGFVLALPVIIPIIIVLKIFEKPVHRSTEEVVEILQRRITDPDWHEWDEFVCVPIAEPELEDIRQQMLKLEPDNLQADGPPAIYLSSPAVSEISATLERLRGHR